MISLSPTKGSTHAVYPPTWCVCWQQLLYHQFGRPRQHIGAHHPYQESSYCGNPVHGPRACSDIIFTLTPPYNNLITYTQARTYYTECQLIHTPKPTLNDPYTLKPTLNDSLYTLKYTLSDSHTPKLTLNDSHTPDPTSIDSTTQHTLLNWLKTNKQWQHRIRAKLDHYM